MQNEPQRKDENDPSLNLDLADRTPELCVALVRAQADVQAVEHDGVNTQLGGKKYASGEAMIRSARPILEKHGLALISTFTSTGREVGRGDIGNQFVCATVVESFALVHEGGGVITGSASMDAIGSRARPNDKAVAATCTYMHGYLLRHLLHMPRGGMDEKLDVDSRSEEGFTPPQQQGRKATTTTRASTPASKPSGDEKTAGLRRAVSKRIEELFAKDPKWDARATTEGEGTARAALFESLGVPTQGRLGAQHLRTVNDFLKERLAVLDKEADPPADDAPADSAPAEYDPGDGKGDEIPDEVNEL